MKASKNVLSGLAMAMVLTLGASVQAREPHDNNRDSERGPRHEQQNDERQREGRMHSEKNKRGGPMAMLFASEEQFARMQKHMQERTQHLREQLQLNPAQDKAWQQLQGAIQNKLKQARTVAANQGLTAQQIHDLPLPQRLDTLQQLHAQIQPIMTSSNDELKTFYALLDPAQKKIMDEKFRMPMAH